MEHGNRPLRKEVEMNYKIFFGFILGLVLVFLGYFLFKFFTIFRRRIMEFLESEEKIYIQKRKEKVKEPWKEPLWSRVSMIVLFLSATVFQVGAVGYFVYTIHQQGYVDIAITVGFLFVIIKQNEFFQYLTERCNKKYDKSINFINGCTFGLVFKTIKSQDEKIKVLEKIVFHTKGNTNEHGKQAATKGS